MKRVFFLLSLFLTISYASASDEEIRKHNAGLINEFISSIPPVVASFSDKEIRKTALIEEINPLLKQFKSTPVKLKDSDMKKLKEAALNSLNEIIEREILDTVAQRDGFTVTDEEIERELGKAASNIEGGMQTIKTEMGLTEGTIKRRAAQGLRIEKWRKNKLIPQSQPDNEQIKKFYDENPEHFTIPPKLKISHIFLKISPGCNENELMKKMQKIAEESDTEAKFRKNAEKFSEDDASKSRGGYLGEFYQDEIPPQLLSAVSKLSPGELSAPFKSSKGIHIVRLDAREDGRVVPLSEATPKIKEFLLDMNSRLNLGRIIIEEREKRKLQILWK